ncbi:hypothetical protein VCR20J5_710001 [Vibrio crassostreae]|nr:hypothetical protein VCR15J5_610289 [Vibrio crassostreae]CDT63924.1 hypothetical protein VCR20J5_710001 [Vibrio crassostreae]
MVERNLAKVEVIGSNPMYRSKLKSPNRNVRAFWFLAFSVSISVLLLFESILKIHFYFYFKISQLSSFRTVSF